MIAESEDGIGTDPLMLRSGEKLGRTSQGEGATSEVAEVS